MKRWLWMSFLGLALPVMAETTLPQTIAQFDQAASRKDITSVTTFYDPSFKNGDGLTRDKLTKALGTLWQNLNNPVYTTEILSTKNDGEQMVIATTRTKISGRWQQGRFSFDLTSDLEAESRWQKNGTGWQLVAQTIKNERTEITNGQRPPKVDITIPAEVNAGKNYELVALLPQPLGQNLVLGGIAQSSAATITPEAPSLDGLQAGGLFKKNRVPTTKEDQLVSLGFVQGDGMYFVTYRIKVN